MNEIAKLIGCGIRRCFIFIRRWIPISSLESFVEDCVAQGGTVFGKELLISQDRSNRILMISHDLNLTGAPVALLHFAQMLVVMGKRPLIIAPHDGPLRLEICEKKIPVVVLPGLFRSNIAVRSKRLFELAVVNTIVSAPIVRELDGAKIPVLWWIHEAAFSYNPCNLNRMPQSLHENVKVVTAGPRAKKNLIKHRPCYAADELLYFIPDIVIQQNCEIDHLFASVKGKFVFAIVGIISKTKGHDILLDAISKLQPDVLQKCLFVFVGRDSCPECSAKLQQLIKDIPGNVRHIPQLNRQEMLNLYHNIDCLICASRDDSMPTVVTEAWAFSKPVICSENTGSAFFMERYCAGIVYHKDNSDELAQCIAKIFHSDAAVLEEMGRNGRIISENFFSADVFRGNVAAIFEWAANFKRYGAVDARRDLQDK